MASDVFDKYGLVWIVTDYAIEIDRLPRYNEKVTITTEAISYNKIFCYRNRGPIQHYLKAIAEDGHAILNEEHLTKAEMMEEEFFLGLRKKSGVSIKRFEEKFGLSFADTYGDIVKKLQEDGLLVKDPEVVRMTKRGLFLGDSVAEQFILED